MQPKGALLRKRTQIDSTNRLMFLWVAGVSVVFGVALVAAIFLVQMLLFNEGVLIEKSKTVSTLDANLKNIKTLGVEVRKLNTNQDLISVKAKPDDTALQVILDALPSDANSLAFGASLQNKLLAGIPGLTVDKYGIVPVVGVESLHRNTSKVSTSSSSSSAQGQIEFSFSATGDEVAFKQALHNLEISIRTIDITTLKIESQSSKRVMTVKGRAFYEPERVVEIKYKVVK